MPGERMTLRPSINTAEESTPLLIEDNGDSNQTPNDGLDSVELSFEEADRILRTFEEATNIITQHLTGQRASVEQHPQLTRRRPPCPRLKSFIGRSMKKISGAKGISYTVLLQLVCLVMLTLVDTLPQSEDEKQLALQMGSVTMMFLQVLNLIIVIIISVQLVKQIKRGRMSGILLLQSYVATVLLFAGIYTASYRMNTKSWRFVEDSEIDGSSNPVIIVEIYARFLFFSVSTATLCGLVIAYPREWYNYAFASAQMLLSFMYFTSVIGAVVMPTQEPKAKSTRGQHL